MSSLKVSPQPANEHGVTIDIVPGQSELEYVGFRLHQLREGEQFSANSGDLEVCLVLLGGRATIVSGEQRFENIGERRDVFDHIPPYSVYLPNDSDYSVTAETDLQLAVCSAPGKGNHPPRLITPDQVKCSTRGEGSNVRHVHDILPEWEPADSLLVVEVYTPPGNWSSYPPHRHDHDNLPHESFLEESYYHRLNPAQGFAFQRVYTDDRSLDETMAVENGECVQVPRGYHPVGAPHGYELYYLNVMAGPTRVWKFHDDPDHAWIIKK
ncbi:5-deoxy-glucuronate isomerase [Carnimonas nigrificans]|uniref:5-deoxy-glucuronate isomerase n=1 Tax=Carnimonas nigrificans TaxID=64323 RepID=UPI00046F155C|nr:5-deoxy-glucuronate isomerase [Carnimonas nigrificans]